MSDPHREMMNLIPSQWDKKPLILASEMKRWLENVKDADTHVDSGGMDGEADLWVVVGGVEYYINIKKSLHQIKKENQLP